MKKAVKAKITYRRTHKGLRSISRLAQEIGRKSFKKQGFNGIEIFKQWPYIVGDELSQYCMPEKINWPRGRAALLDEAQSTTGATLVIKCLGAFALEIQSLSPIILQRANIMFGYTAISKLKIRQVQQLELIEKFHNQPQPKVPEQIKHSTATIKNDDLRTALNALGAQIHRPKA